MNSRNKLTAAVLAGIALGWIGASFLQLPRVQSAPADVPEEKPPAVKYKKLIPSLLAAVRDSDPTIRQYAAQALGYIGRDSLPAVMALLKSKDKEDRWRGVSVMIRLRPGEGAEAIPLLLNILNDKSEGFQTRIGAVQAIRDALKPPA